jgi:hypothetical protein
MVDIAEKPPRQLAPSMGTRRSDFIIRIEPFINVYNKIFIGSFTHVDVFSIIIANQIFV